MSANTNVRTITLTQHTSVYPAWEPEADGPGDPEVFTRTDTATSVDMVIELLDMAGVIEASSSDWYPGVWYSAEVYMNPYTGELEENTLHVDGLTEDESRAVFAAFTS
jgi:hypothetical protein